MITLQCTSCKVWFRPELQEDKHLGFRMQVKGKCKGCYLELYRGYIPMVTDSTLAPSGTGTTPRQQAKRGSYS